MKQMLCALVLVASTWSGPAAAATGPAEPSMVPLLGISRVDSPDRPFIQRAAEYSVASMKRADGILATATDASVQAEAVRAFNTSAATYNDLVDIAAKRRVSIKVTAPQFGSSKQTVTPVDGAPIRPSDIAYANARPQNLLETIVLYRAEANSGRDPLVVAFARKFAPRIEHDLTLATLNQQELTRGAGALSR